jgi:hypothetical protein
VSTSPSESFAPSSLPRVDGKCLVVSSGTVLPPICVKTNQSVSEGDVVRGNLYWCPTWVVLAGAFSGPLLILVYFIARKKCSIAFGLQPSLRRRLRIQTLLTVIGAVTLFFALPFAAATDSTPVVISVVALLIVAVVALFVGNSPLAVVKYREGMFWIEGFSGRFRSRFDLNTPVNTVTQ